MSAAKASAVGYFFRVMASSSASVYLPRGRKPLYQMSKGSSGRPSRASISFATRGTSGEPRICSSMASTRASGSSRSKLNRRAIRLGAAGVYGSASRAARKVSSSRA